MAITLIVSKMSSNIGRKLEIKPNSHLFTSSLKGLAFTRFIHNTYVTLMSNVTQPPFVYVIAEGTYIRRIVTFYLKCAAHKST